MSLKKNRQIKCPGSTQIDKVMCTRSHGEKGAEFIGLLILYQSSLVQNCAKSYGKHKSNIYLVLILQEEGRKELSLCACHSFWCERWMAAMSHAERPRASRKKQIEKRCEPDENHGGASEHAELSSACPGVSVSGIEGRWVSGF